MAQWTFGPPGVATEIPTGINPSALGGDFMFDMQTRSASNANYFLTPFNQNYHWYFGHLPRAQWGTVCNVETDPSGTQCRSNLDKEELDKLASLIQEGNMPPAKYLNATQEQSSIVFNKKAKVTASFLQESAGYSNTFGFFRYNSNALPTDANTLDTATILFPNTSFQGSGGYMRSGDSVSLGVIDPATGDDGLGFYLAANGWHHNRGQGLNGQYFYSLSDLNPEVDKADSKHMLLIAKSEVNQATNTQRLWVAIEDIRLDTGSSDRDYNDLIIQLDVFPADAIANLENIPTLDNSTAIDADNDGG